MSAAPHAASGVRMVVAGLQPDPSPPSSSEPEREAVDLPEIWPDVVTANTVDAVLRAAQSDDQLFVRAGHLTRVIESDGTDPGPTREMGAPMMRRAVPSWLTERFSLCARFMKMTSKGRSQSKTEVAVQTPPPAWIAPHVIERGHYPGYKRLVGIVTSPTIRRDGSILQEPGHDAASGLLFSPRGRYTRVPDAPTLEQARAARDRLLDVIADFPLSDDGRAGWLALLLTLVARDLVDGQVPLVAIDAHSAGSGKGLIVQVAHIIAIGVTVPHMSLPPSEEEFRKQITTTLLGGDAALLLDNVSVPLGGDSLEALITAPVWKTRMLGTLEDSGAIAVRIVTIATGNGLQFVGDMGRRTLRIHLDTPHETPEERADYKHKDRAGEDKLLAWVREHRCELVVDALTVLRAWHVAGRRGEVKPWGSFAGWCATVGRCVQWIGLPDPTLGRATQDAALDPQRQALAIIYDAIRRLGSDRGLTAGDIVHAAFPPPHGPPNGEDDLAEAIDTLTPNSRGDARTRARLLGRKLKAGRTIDGLRLTVVPGRARSVRYTVTPNSAQSGNGHGARGE